MVYPGDTFDGWVLESGETDANAGLVNYTEDARNLKTYNESLGGTATTEAFMLEVLEQARYNWRPGYTACAVNNYIRDGFDKEIVECEYL